MFKLNAKFDANSLFYSVILNGMATQYTCSLNGIYHPHLTSTVRSLLFMHAHSSLLSLDARIHQCHANHSCYIVMVELSPDLVYDFVLIGFV